MNVQARHVELLACGYVALAAYLRSAVRLDAPGALVSWLASALRVFGAHRIAPISQHRVSPAQGPAMEQGRLGDRLLRALRRDALPDCFGAPMGYAGTGVGRPLLSKKQKWVSA